MTIMTQVENERYICVRCLTVQDKTQMRESPKSRLIAMCTKCRCATFWPAR